MGDGTRSLRRRNPKGQRGLRRFFDFAALNAGSAYANALGRAFHHRVDFLEVNVPAPFRQIVSVAHPVTELGTSPANITHLRHLDTLLLIYSS
jgi:hypothetical protein